MNGYLTSLAGLPGRFVSTSYNAERGMIEVEISDADGNVKATMGWGYSEPVEEPDPNSPATEDGAE